MVPNVPPREASDRLIIFQVPDLEEYFIQIQRKLNLSIELWYSEVIFYINVR